MTNPSTVCATVLIDELLRGGVSDFVMAPGSRNAPLSFAVLAAERAGRARLHVRIDERGAGFLALGLALGSGRPVVVMCTSGTAVANLHPAVIEADRSGVPLVVLSANRPADLLGTGANQTITQSGMFGSTTRLEAHIPAGVAKNSDAAWRSRVSRILASARGVGHRSGPVHLDVAFATPLTPAGDLDPLSIYPGRPDSGAWTTVDEAAPAQVELVVADRTLVVVGDAAVPLARSAITSAAVLGIPCHVEAGRSLAQADETCLQHGGWLLADADFVQRAKPDLVVVVGRPTLGRALGALLVDPEITVIVVDDQAEWTDPQHDADHFVYADAIDFRCAADVAWVREWITADTAVGETLDHASWDSALVCRVVADSADGPLVVGSSNSIRDVDLWARRRSRGAVIANRGAAGIDGTVSTAIGAALALPETPSVALVGDLTFLHDSTALVIGPDEPRPDLTIVVVNNDGGAIFGLLEQGGPAYADSFERIFGTPHAVDLAALCASTGTPHEAVTGAEALTACLARRPPGISVIEARVSRADDRAVRASRAAAVAAALRGLSS